MNDRLLTPRFLPTAEPTRSVDGRLLAEAVLEQVRDLIVQGDLLPGSRLNERLLCERLKISRTPLREALKALAGEGLVELQPNRGARVTPLTVDKVREVFRVLSALEAVAGELACEFASDADIAEIRAMHYQMVAHYKRGELREYFRFNQAIHIRLVQVGGNVTLAQTYQQLNAHVRRARYLANHSPERWEKAVAEHEAMLDALVARDPTRLKTLLAEHLGAKMMAVLAALESEETDNNVRAAAYD